MAFPERAAGLRQSPVVGPEWLGNVKFGVPAALAADPPG
jgi:hypothetical protein